MALGKTIVLVAVIAILAGVVFVFNLELERQRQIPQDVKYVETGTGDEYLTQEFAGDEEVNPQITVDEPGFEKATTSSDCEKRQGYLKGECFRALAFLDDDESFCEKAYEVGQRDSCINDVAVKKNDAKLCKELFFDAPDCMREIALKTGNPIICEMAGYEKDVCIQASRSGNFELCTHLGLNRGICNDAAYQKNSALCENIIDASKNCFFEFAEQTLKAQYCEKVGELKNTCVFRIAMQTKNTATCNLLTENRDNCIARIALETNNPALCDQAGTEKQNCIEDLR